MRSTDLLRGTQHGACHRCSSQRQPQQHSKFQGHAYHQQHLPHHRPNWHIVTVTGTGLTQTTKVTIGGVKATTFTVKSDSSVTVTIPNACKTGKITVTTNGGSATSSSSFNVTPTITSFTPSSGKVGTSVVITGTGLTQTTKLTFGGVTATTFTINSDTQVTATVPTGAITGKIAITTTGGTVTSSGTFTVTP